MKTMATRTPSDVVMHVFGFLEARSRFLIDVPKIHRAFFILHKNRKFSVLFKDFVFDETKTYPECEAVRSTLDKLMKARLLSNVDLLEYEITDELENSDPSKLFNPREIILLKEAAEKFKELIF